ncbi:MAG: MATE family efflux transporter [Clostridiales bacterium]|nr:MATE family efflux transporter [Clostridiales bacterium]
MTQTRRPANAITEGVIWQQLLKFFFPILLGTFFQQLYNTVDAMIVGKFVGKEALAAVGGATATLANLMVGFFTGLSSGATVIISQFYGARKHEEVSRTVHTAAAMTLAGGVIIMVLGLVFSPALLRMMGTPEDVLPGAITYIRIFFCGMVPSLIYNIGTGILRAVGDSRRPLYFLIAACMVNIVLDVLLVVGLEMGVAGAALATILSQLVSGTLITLTLIRSHDAYRLFPKKIRFHGDLLARVVRIGFPAGMQSVMYSLSNLIIQTAINGFGTNVMAAWTAYGKMDGLFWMTINAFGVAITTFVGQNFGAGKYERMRRSVRQCLLMAAIATVALSSFLLLMGGTLLRLFSGDEAVVTHGLQIVRTLVPTYFTFICIEVLSGAVRGTGDTLIPTLMTLTGVCLLRVIWISFVVPQHHELRTVLLSYPITWTITSVLFIVYYLKGGWMKRGMKNREA